jgi:DNA topoisomerase IB
MDLSASVASRYWLARKVASCLAQPRTWIHLGGDLEGSYDGFKYVDIRVIGHTEHAMFASKEIFENAMDLFPALKVAARYKDKKISDKGNPIYMYSERQVALRNKKKAERLEKLRSNIGRLKSQVKKDLHADDRDKALSALAVALMDHTYERVGNEGSADEGHFGVTGWTRKHVSFGKGKATIKYVGKSGVKQEKSVTDKAILSALKKAYDDEGEEIFSYKGGRVDASKVNAYLKQFDVTAKDIRGFHANSTMQEKLRAARKGKLSDDPKERKETLKAEFKKALEETAEEVGHEASTLRSQYLVPGLEDQFMKDGTVPAKMKLAAIAERVLDRYLDQAP